MDFEAFRRLLSKLQSQQIIICTNTYVDVLSSRLGSSIIACGFVIGLSTLHFVHNIYIIFDRQAMKFASCVDFLEMWYFIIFVCKILYKSVYFL